MYIIMNFVDQNDAFCFVIFWGEVGGAKDMMAKQEENLAYRYMKIWMRLCPSVLQSVP